MQTTPPNREAQPAHVRELVDIPETAASVRAARETVSALETPCAREAAVRLAALGASQPTAESVPRRRPL